VSKVEPIPVGKLNPRGFSILFDYTEFLEGRVGGELKWLESKGGYEYTFTYSEKYKPLLVWKKATSYGLMEEANGEIDKREVKRTIKEALSAIRFRVEGGDKAEEEVEQPKDAWDKAFAKTLEDVRKQAKKIQTLAPEQVPYTSKHNIGARYCPASKED
jgi:hypothetical protein